MNKISNYLDSLYDDYSDYLTYCIIDKKIPNAKKKKKKKPGHKPHKPHCPHGPHGHHHQNPIVGPYPPIKPKPDNNQCNCDCCKNKKKKTEYDVKQDKALYGLKSEVIKVKEILEKISGQPVDIDINKIVNMVIKKQKPHEDNQTSNIQQNREDINDLNNITIWDNNTNFNNG